MKVLDCIALHLNNFRVAPRILLGYVCHLAYITVHWALTLPRPIDMADVSLVGTVTALFGVSIKFYLDTGGFQRTDHDA